MRSDQAVADGLKEVPMREPLIFQAVRAVLWKELLLWSRHWQSILASLVMPLTYVVVAALGAAAVGANPVALVVEDQGTAARQIAQALADAQVFRISAVNATEAEQLYNNLQVAAIISIPPGFSARVEQHQAAAIEVQVNNLNLDITNDIRRAVPDAISVYYAQLPANPLGVSVAEADLRSRDVEIFQFAVVPMIGLLLLVHALISAGLSTAREWEEQSIKELLLCPVPRAAIILGKVLSGWLTTFLLGLVMLGLGYGLGWTRPAGFFLLSTCLAMGLMALFASGLGIALGTALKRVQAVTSLSTTLSVWLFFLAGGIGVIQFEPDWLKQVAAFDPLTYGTHALQMAIFYQSSELFTRDVLVLAGTALATMLLGVLALKRGLSRQGERGK
jgi:ABC-type multidrug transport system permease subunit